MYVLQKNCLVIAIKFTAWKNFFFYFTSRSKEVATAVLTQISKDNGYPVWMPTAIISLIKEAVKN